MFRSEEAVLCIPWTEVYEALLLIDCLTTPSWYEALIRPRALVELITESSPEFNPTSQSCQRLV